MIDPKEIIKELTVEELCETAEDYFASIKNPIPQMEKPFSSLLEAPEMLQNMGLLLSGLNLAKTMTVLEFGAGTCWFSRYLNQAQCVTICCDASKTALDLGKRLFKESPIMGEIISEPRFLHFNGHKIDLPDESVDRIICYDAFHHIPNQSEVLSELARVLKKGGIAGFCEPGLYHSQSAQSQYEMKNYRVLENDIIIPEIFEIAKKCGFTDIEIKLLSAMNVSLAQHQKIINKDISSKGAFTIIDNISSVMTNKTIFFLRKGEMTFDSRSHIGLSHSIVIEKDTYTTTVGEELEIVLYITNTGVAKWLNENVNLIGVVMIGMHLYGESNKLLDLDFSRHPIECVTEPGEKIEKVVKVRFPEAGKFKLAIDLVSEGVCWFENIGSQPQSIIVNVE